MSTTYDPVAIGAGDRPPPVDPRQRWALAAVRSARNQAGKGTRPQFLRAADSDVDLAAVGIAFLGEDGAYCGAGQDRLPFSLQSLTKVFALCLALSLDGQRLWRRIGFRAVEHAYDTIAGLDRPFAPPNPLFNAGALVVVDRLISLTGGAALPVRSFLLDAAGRQHDALRTGSDAGDFDCDDAVAQAELVSGYRNKAIAYALAGAASIDNDPEQVLAEYVRLCAMRASCASVTAAAQFLALSGRSASGAAVLAAREVRRVNALLTLSGTYDASARTLFRVGLPIKSGVGGGIVAVMPGRGVIAAWSPCLDRSGTSRAALHAASRFANSLDGS